MALSDRPLPNNPGAVRFPVLFTLDEISLEIIKLTTHENVSNIPRKTHLDRWVGEWRGWACCLCQWQSPGEFGIVVVVCLVGGLGVVVVALWRKALGDQ